MEYHKIIKLCQSSTNWLDNTSDGDLPPTEKKTAAASMTLLRRTLQRQGRLVEAQQLVKNESSLQQLDKCLVPYAEILVALEEQELQRYEIFQLMSASTKTFMADRLDDIGEKSKVVATLSSVEDMMRENFGRHWESIAPRLKLLIDRFLLTSCSTTSSEELVHQHIALGTRAAALKDSPILRVCLRSSYLHASKVADQGQTSFLKASSKKLEKERLMEYFSFEAKQAKSAYFLSSAVVSFLWELSKELKTSQVIEVVKDFELQYPQFDNPQTGEMIMYHAAAASKDLGDVVGEEHYRAKRQRFREQCSFMRRTVSGTYVLQEIDDYNYNREWEIPSSGIWPHFQVVSTRILLRWVISGFKAGHISDENIVTFLRMNQTDSLINMEEVLSKASPEELSHHLFGLDLPHPPEIWNPWFETFSSWLKVYSLGPSRSQRHRLLKEISNIRSIWVTKTNPESRSLEDEQDIK